MCEASRNLLTKSIERGSNGATDSGLPPLSWSPGAGPLGLISTCFQEQDIKKLPPQPASCSPVPQELRGFGLHPLCFQLSLQFNHGPIKGKSASRRKTKADGCSLHKPWSPELQLTHIHMCVCLCMCVCAVSPLVAAATKVVPAS